jgi:hypothetical protein
MPTPGLPTTQPDYRDRFPQHAGTCQWLPAIYPTRWSGGLLGCWVVYGSSLGLSMQASEG